MTHVEIDIFSGRPNPQWTLTADESAALAQLLDALPATAAALVAAPALPDLGFRGFVVTSDGAAGPLRVFIDTVTLPDGRHVADANGAERWLFDSARSHGHGPLVDAIAAMR